MKLEIEIPEVADMEALGARLAPGIAKVQLIYLNGELGTG
ncbi:MAG: tRNA (adenosine(37)-N6)-threonylcarbamoyltransferase complex ATPase subunit type 1 TsaE, partial [Proteobacteria bacterium]